MDNNSSYLRVIISYYLFSYYEILKESLPLHYVSGTPFEKGRNLISSLSKGSTRRGMG